MTPRLDSRRSLGTVWSNGSMATQVEELPDNKVRLTVDVPRADVHHAVAHAASALASSVKSPGFLTATVSVLPKPEVADWTTVQVPYVEPEVPEDFVDHELNVLRSTVAELKPAEGRPAEAGDTIVLDLLADDGGQRDYVGELGSGRLLPELEEKLVGMSAGETKEIDLERGSEGEPIKVEAVVKEIKEKVLPE